MESVPRRLPRAAFRARPRLALEMAVVTAGREVGGLAEALWRVEQTASFLNMSLSWVYKAAAVGSLPSIRIGSSLRFEPEQVRRFARGELRTTVVRRSQVVSVIK